MKSILTVVLIIVVSITINGSDSKYEIYVSPNGSDNGIFEISNPIASLERAVELARGKAPVTKYN